MTVLLRPVLALALFFTVPAAARAQLPTGFVYLRDVAPQIAQEIRYATPNNFTGSALPGYAAGECVLRRDAAEALARVAQDLARQKLGLKTYDCYRPARAVAAMWRWAHDGARAGEKRFYPNVDKRKLFALGYIAAHSRHSAGTAVDLTLIALPVTRAAANIAEHDSPCTAPAVQHARDTAPGVPLDMGTGFDCLDEKSYTHSGAVTPEQHRARERLRAAMTARGFRNYFREWWHYEFAGGGAPLRAYDFPITSR